jgi:hypothetical protein
MILTILKFTDEVIYPAFETEWIGRDMPEPIISLLYIGNVLLPPYVINAPQDDSAASRLAAKTSLEAADLFQDASRRDWFLRNGSRFPATASYICQLDLMRRLCLDALTE